MSAPSSLHCFMTPTNTQGMNVAAVTAPNIETMLLTEEEQAQWDSNDLVKVLEDTNHKQKSWQARDVMHRPPGRSARWNITRWMQR